MTNYPTDPLPVLIAAVLMLIRLGIICGAIFAIHYLLSLPIQRVERGMFFLDLIDTGLKHGKRIEETIVSASATADQALAARFHILAAWLEKGLSLTESLAKVPRLLPEQIVEILRAGQRIGDIAQVLPACRQLLQDAISQTRGAMNYMIVLAFGLTPVNVAILSSFAIYVLPGLSKTYAAYFTEDSAPPALWQFVQDNVGWLLAAQASLAVVLLLAGFVYVANPYVVSLLRSSFGPLPDKIAWAVPWKRKRMQRTFSTMLSVLLDAGVPEVEAVQLAADCTANAVVKQRAGKVTEAIRHGTKLTEAIHALDESGELRWRITNATHGAGGFLQALTGWHEALDAKAFQLEQGFAHIASSALVVINGLLIATVVGAVFSGLIAIINIGVQW